MAYFLLPLLIAILDWLTIARRWNKLQAITKPGTMAAVLVWIFLSGVNYTPIIVLFIIGVVFSLLGDIFLLQQIDNFIAGTFAFLAAHTAYIIGLNTTAFPLNFSTLLFALAVVMLVFRIYRQVRKGLIEKEGSNHQVLVLVYAIVLGVMVFFGLATLAIDDWAPAAALLIATGSVLFGISDILLIWNRYVETLPAARLKTRIPYHLGQIMLIAGVLLFAM